VDGAIKLMASADPEKIKQKDHLKNLTDYLNRVRECIPCHALRKELGLRNSSNKGEKSNDLVVASRQKHNGMKSEYSDFIPYPSNFRNRIVKKNPLYYIYYAKLLE
jgi:hypothetical protein